MLTTKGFDMFKDIRNLMIFLGFLLVFSSMAAVGETIQLTPGVKQLFLDDYIIAEKSNLGRTMHTPEKRGAVMRSDIPSDGYGIQVRGAPTWVKDEGKYKIIYLVMGKGPAFADSNDGLVWRKPSLGLVNVDGSKNNNHVRVDANAPWGTNLIEGYFYDPYDVNPAQRYKGMLGDLLRKPIVSSDGLHWTAFGENGVNSGDEAQLNQDKKNNRFIMTVKSYDTYGRAVSIAYSTDFKNWTSPVKIFGADALDQQLAKTIIQKRINDANYWKPTFVDPNVWKADVYNMPTFPYEGIYIGLPAFLYSTGWDAAHTNHDGFHHIQLVMSRDLTTWQRLGNREAFIGPSKINNGFMGIFDRTQLLATSVPVVHGDELWFYYTGLKWRDRPYDYYADRSPRPSSTWTSAEKADVNEGVGAMCLAVLRLDGFISLDANSNAGYIKTKPFIMKGNSLYLNIDAAGGQAKVEILDSNDKPIVGFTANDCDAITSNSVRIQVQWANKANLSSLSGKTVKLKISLTNAHLYAFGTDIPSSDRKEACYPYSNADLNSDCTVDGQDFAMLAQNWVQCSDPTCDQVQ
jgi:hypothetical protein